MHYGLYFLTFNPSQTPRFQLLNTCSVADFKLLWLLLYDHIVPLSNRRLSNILLNVCIINLSINVTIINACIPVVLVFMFPILLALVLVVLSSLSPQSSSCLLCRQTVFVCLVQVQVQVSCRVVVQVSCNLDNCGSDLVMIFIVY